MEYSSCQNTVENEVKLRKNEGDNIVNFNARKRPHHDPNKPNCKTNIDVLELKDSDSYGDNTSMYSYKEHSLVDTGQISPHVKRMCFEHQQCRS